MREILHAHRDGKMTALDHPQAVVVDYETQMIRSGLDRWPVSRPAVFRMLAFLLRSANHLQTYSALCAALGLRHSAQTSIAERVHASDAIFEALGMTIETIDGQGYILHTDPRETIPCFSSIAPGLPVPSRLRSIPSVPGGRRTIRADSLAQSTTSSAR